MSDLEALIWRLEARYPERRSTMTLVVGFDGPVSAPTVADRLAAVVAAVPRLRARVAPPALAMAVPRWEPDPEFHLGAHVRRAEGPDAHDLMLVAEDMVGRPFEPGRPPWRAVFVPEVAGGRGSGLVLHLHHSYTDGLGALLLAASLFDFGGMAEYARDAPAERSGVFSSVVEEVVGAAGLLGRVVPWALRSLRDPVESGAALAAVAGFLRAQLGAVSGPASPVMSRRSARLHLARLALSVDGMRAAGRRLGTTLNDVFLSGLLGGLALYHDKHAAAPPSLRVGIPMSTRPSGSARQDSSVMQNQLFAAIIKGPLAVRNPDERTRLVHEMVGMARSSPLFGLVDELAGLGRRVPGSESLLALVTGSLDVVASNLSGSPSDLWLGGVRVAEMVPFGPRSGAALNATLLSHAGTAHVGLNLDPVAVPDAGVLVDCLRRGFEEYLVA